MIIGDGDGNCDDGGCVQ